MATDITDPVVRSSFSSSPDVPSVDPHSVKDNHTSDTFLKKSRKPLLIQISSNKFLSIRKGISHVTNYVCPPKNEEHT